jgi:HAD superfamily hydrolase (TIGR01490 family)
MRLALFDLDHTLIPIDSDHAWGGFLVRNGKVDAEAFARANDRFYDQYRDGTLDIDAYLRFALEPLVRIPSEDLAQLRRAFMEEIVEAAILPQALALLDSHRGRGETCILITATNEFVTAPIAQRLGIEHLIACRAEQVHGSYTGLPTGIASFREGKFLRLIEWLEVWGGINKYDGSALERVLAEAVFYSDSSNDLPLLERVGRPVATNADAKLRKHAQRLGWRTLELFTDAPRAPIAGVEPRKKPPAWPTSGALLVSGT